MGETEKSCQNVKNKKYFNQYFWNYLKFEKKYRIFRPLKRDGSAQKKKEQLKIKAKFKYRKEKISFYFLLSNLSDKSLKMSIFGTFS